MSAIDNQGMTEQEFLASYNPGDYERPSVAADIVIFTIADADEQNYRKLSEKELRILLIKRGGHPYLGTWALPGGFVRPYETVGGAARRELLEETGVEQSYLEQLYTFSEPGRDPRTWVMSCTHMALVDSKKLQIKAGDDASEAQWYQISYSALAGENGEKKRYRLQLTAGSEQLSAIVAQKDGSDSMEYEVIENHGLAFDHAGIIACAVSRLRGKVEYTDLAFNLMPEKFTLTQLQQVYEVILDRPLLKAAFRRKIKDLVTETGEYTEHAGHRPSQLFRRSKEK